MKFNLLRLLPCLLAFGLMASCGEKAQKTVAPKKVVKTTTSEGETEVVAMPNFRYVEDSTIFLKYNLAVDFTEQMIKQQSAMEAEMKKLDENLQNQQKVMQDKLQSGQYKSQADMESDQKRLMELQKTAEEKMAQMQQELLTVSAKNNQTVTDSIRKFIEDYNAEKGYDAIFFKAATLYIDPALDITDEIVEGLNARYNKVKK